MIEIKVCQHCHKAYYSIPSGYPSPCVHCGSIFKPRVSDRVKVEIDWTFRFKGKDREATVKDYSSGGAMIVYPGESLPVNAMLGFAVDVLAINRPAVAVWTKKMGGSFNASGLRMM